MINQSVNTIDLPPILIKVGKREFLENLVNNGEVYFGASSFYRGDKTLEGVENPEYQKTLGKFLLNIEDEYAATFDPLESVSSIEYPTNMNENFNVKFNESHSHILSLYGFSLKLPFDFEISKKMKDFGYDTFTIFDSKHFLSNLIDSINIVSLHNYDNKYKKPAYGYITYYDLIPGKNIYNLTQFHKKKSAFGHQMEFRVVANLPINKNLLGGSIINLGGPLFTDSKLGKNAEVYPIDDLYNIELFIQ